MEARYCKFSACPLSKAACAVEDCDFRVWDLQREKRERGGAKSEAERQLTPTEAQEQEELVAWCERNGNRIYDNDKKHRSRLKWRGIKS